MKNRLRNIYRMRIYTAFIPFILSACTLSGGDEPSSTTHSTSIEKCREQSIKTVAPSTAERGEELENYSLCLEGVILRLAEKVYPPKGRTTATVRIKRQLKQLSDAYGGFYDDLRNGNKWCPCGQTLIHTSIIAYNELLEKMVVDMEDVIERRTEFDESLKHAPHELPVYTGKLPFPHANKPVFSQ